MASGKICVVCAWRENCNKKFSISKKPGATCIDFTRDLSIPKDDDEVQEQEHAGHQDEITGK